MSTFEAIIFSLLTLLLPTQLGKHFWPDFSLIQGIRVDYLSPTLYVTDILIGVLLVSWVLRKYNNHDKKTKNAKRKMQNNNLILRLLSGQDRNIFTSPFSSLSPTLSIFFIFIAFLFINILLSNRMLVGMYGLAKFLEYSFLAYYIAVTIRTRQQLHHIVLLLAVGVIGEALLGISQYVQQGSLGGVFYFIGERSFTSATPGIANASINGALLLRPYGTFPHPNVLAGFILCSLLFILFLFRSYKAFWKRIILGLALGVGSIILFLSLSRVAVGLWIITLVILLILQLRKTLRNKNIRLPVLGLTFAATGLVVFILLSSPLSARFFQSSFSEESFLQRKTLIDSSLIMIREHPLFGVGLCNFLPTLATIQKPLSLFLFVQPVHNIFLLLAAETGLIGIGFFLWLLVKTYRRLFVLWKNSSSESAALLVILSVIVILGMFDHYWLTLQQGQLFFTYVIGLSWTSLFGNSLKQEA